MKNANERLVSRFYDLCEDIKKSKDFEDLYFRLGLACGFISGMFLADIIDIYSYQKMHEYISTIRDEMELNKKWEGELI